LRNFQLDLEDKIVAIDGKTSRRSFDGDNKPMHLVSAFVNEVAMETVVFGDIFSLC
jgi:hypothetical protein